ncbi:MAG: hypothetical protein HQL00_05440, partial [Nitrospirae bacterium]|nr:hypothetical protein [Nitrospirota bacterium]
MHENLHYKWKKSLTDNGGDGYTAEEKAKLRKLKKQLRDVTEEREKPWPSSQKHPYKFIES